MKQRLGFLGLSLIVFFFVTPRSRAAQDGPYFPPHRFPTDRSFHIGYDFNYLSSKGNFDSEGQKLTLTDDSSIGRIRHRIRPEYQPSRQFAFGAYFQVDSASAGDGQGGAVSKTALSDQVIWGEYRLFDIPGASIALASLVKFPLYSNPTIDDLTSSDPDPGSVVLLGDAQNDVSALLATELWPSTFLRVRGNFGFTFRSDSFASELPYMLSMAFVSTKVDLALKISGNFSLGNDDLSESDPASASNTNALRQAFSGSNYALSENPSLTKFGVAAEFWFDPRWALHGNFEIPFRGKNAPHFWSMALGLSYRWAEADRAPRKTAREVDIGVDQEKGRFEAEAQEDEFF